MKTSLLPIILRALISACCIPFLLLGLAACTSSGGSPTSGAPMALTFMAGYKPQANLPFVGVYVAQEKGFFEREGLQVNIQHSPGKGEHLQLTTLGQVHVTTQDAAVLLKRRADPGLPLVSIALIGQRGQQAFAALASSGLVTPKDWEGHTVGFKGTPPPDLPALLHITGADPKKVQLVNVGFDPRVLTEGQVDVYPIFKSNEPYLIRSWGYDLILWDPADYGIPTLGLTYVASEETLKNHSEMITRFLRAALDGIVYAEDHIEEALDCVMLYAGPETDREHMRYMLESELEDLRSEVTDANGLGWQSLGEWQALADLLIEVDAMPPTDVAAVFTNQLLQSIYGVEP